MPISGYYGFAMTVESASLLFGRETLELRWPADAPVDVLRKPSMPRLADPVAAVRDALDGPVDAPPIADLARDAATACIVVCDITRPVPNGLFLRPLIERLIAAGVPVSGITVLIATGLHRPNLGEEMREVIGDDWVIDHVTVLNHDARDESSLVDLGPTPTRQTPVTLNRHFVEADVRIVTGLVEPHFMAGYSGGRKVIAPGVAGHRTIRTFHNAVFMGDPLAVTCNLAGNPLHEEQLAIVEKVGRVYAINTVIDEDRHLSFINFGDILASHYATVDFTRAYSELSCERRYDLIVTSAAGYPLDKTYYQTVKGMVTPLAVLAEGGDLLIVSACEEGLGSPEYVDAQRRLVEMGSDAFIRSLHAKAMADVDEWQSQMLMRPTRLGRVHFHTSGIDPDDFHLTGVNRCDDLQAFLDAYLADRPDARVAVIPEGPYVVPLLAAMA